MIMSSVLKIWKFLCYLLFEIKFLFTWGSKNDLTMMIRYWVFIIFCIDKALSLPESERNLKLGVAATSPNNQIDETKKRPQNPNSESMSWIFNSK